MHNGIRIRYGISTIFWHIKPPNFLVCPSCNLLYFRFVAIVKAGKTGRIAYSWFYFSALIYWFQPALVPGLLCFSLDLRYSLSVLFAQQSVRSSLAIVLVFAFDFFRLLF